MLKLCKNTETTTYCYKRGYYVDIVKENGVYNAWLYHNTLGFKMHMFGICINNVRINVTLESMLEMVEDHIESYISLYRETYKEDLEC